MWRYSKNRSLCHMTAWSLRSWLAFSCTTCYYLTGASARPRSGLPEKWSNRLDVVIRNSQRHEQPESVTLHSSAPRNGLHITRGRALAQVSGRHWSWLWWQTEGCCSQMKLHLGVGLCNRQHEWRVWLTSNRFRAQKLAMAQLTSYVVDAGIQEGGDRRTG